MEVMTPAPDEVKCGLRKDESYKGTYIPSKENANLSSNDASCNVHTVDLTLSLWHIVDQYVFVGFPSVSSEIDNCKNLF